MAGWEAFFFWDIFLSSSLLCYLTAKTNINFFLESSILSFSNREDAKFLSMTQLIISSKMLCTLLMKQIENKGGNAKNKKNYNKKVNKTRTSSKWTIYLYIRYKQNVTLRFVKGSNSVATRISKDWLKDSTSNSSTTVYHHCLHHHTLLWQWGLIINTDPSNLGPSSQLRSVCGLPGLGWYCHTMWYLVDMGG